MERRQRRPDRQGALFSEESLRLFVASNRNLKNRLIHCGAVCVGSIAFEPPLWAAGWAAAALALAFAGWWVATRIAPNAEPNRRRNIAGILFATTVVNSTLYASWALLLSHSPIPGALLFAVVTFFISMVYVLMQYYAAPRIFLAVEAPYIAALAAMGGASVAPQLAAGHYWVGVSFLAASVAVFNFLRVSRHSLDQSRSALRQARALATERETAAAAANRAKSAFLATMSHEIRTPLNGVLGMAQAMAADGLPARQRTRLDVIQQSGQALLAILNDILDLSKIEAGKLTLEDGVFDLGELASGARAVFAATADGRDLKFSLTLEDGAAGSYRGDPTRVRQILYNLLSNAVKFTPEGEIRASLGRTPSGIRLTVADTGIGIEPQALARLFNKFVQADDTTTRRFGGTGLGLAICRELAVMMDGTIRAESEPGKGSIFIVNLPLPRVDAPAAAPVRAEVAEPEEIDAASLKVLAAEDNEVNQLVLKTLLGQIGVTPTIVGDGRQALEAWRAERWDLILMDIQMPEMDGLAATAAIRAEERAAGRPRTPIVALTADALAHQTASYGARGMDGCVAKPIEAARLFEALSLALAEPEAPAEATAA
jgi:signal transduction histidine kinase/ActR/RegA family two-component response regulator